MKKILLSMLVLITSCSSFQQQTKMERSPNSGDRTRGDGNMGNGGGACVCKSPKDSSITYAELVDFIVVKEESSQDVQFNKSNEAGYKDVLARIYADNRLSKGGRAALKQEIESFKIEFRKSKSISLKATSDSRYDIDCNLALQDKQKEFCEYKQVANYTNDGVLLIKEDVFKALSETDKAGLMLHEALYSLDRKYNKAEWADDTRIRVGSYFAGDLKPINDFLAIIKPEPKLNIYLPKDSEPITRLLPGIILQVKDVADYVFGDISHIIARYDTGQVVENPNSTTGQFLNSWDVSRSCSLFYDSKGWGSKYVRLKNINKPIQFKIVENENSKNRQYMFYKHIQFLTLQNINTPELPPKWGINCHYGVRDLINNDVIDQADRIPTISELKKSVGRVFDFIGIEI